MKYKWLFDNSKIITDYIKLIVINQIYNIICLLNNNILVCVMIATCANDFLNNLIY